MTLSSRHEREKQHRENERLAKLGWSMMTRAERKASEERGEARLQERAAAHRAQVEAVLMNPTEALAEAFEKTAATTQAQLAKWALGFSERPMYQLAWAGTELFETAALNELSVHYAAACRGEGFTLENFIDYLTREATRAAVNCPNSTSPTQVLAEQAKGRVVCQMVFRDGFSSSAVTVPGFYLNPIDFAKLALAYAAGDADARRAIIAKH